MPLKLRKNISGPGGLPRIIWKTTLKAFKLILSRSFSSSKALNSLFFLHIRIYTNRVTVSSRKNYQGEKTQKLAN